MRFGSLPRGAPHNTAARSPTCQPAKKASSSPIDAAVDAASKRCGCRIGVAARHLESGLTYERNASQEFESAFEGRHSQ